MHVWRCHPLSLSLAPERARSKNNTQQVDVGRGRAKLRTVSVCPVVSGVALKREVGSAAATRAFSSLRYSLTLVAMTSCGRAHRAQINATEIPRVKSQFGHSVARAAPSLPYRRGSAALLVGRGNNGTGRACLFCAPARAPLRPPRLLPRPLAPHGHLETTAGVRSPAPALLPHGHSCGPAAGRCLRWSSPRLEILHGAHWQLQNNRVAAQTRSVGESRARARGHSAAGCQHWQAQLAQAG